MLVRSQPGMPRTEQTLARRCEHLGHRCCNPAGKPGSRTVRVICGQSFARRTKQVVGAVRQSVIDHQIGLHQAVADLLPIRPKRRLSKDAC